MGYIERHQELFRRFSTDVNGMGSEITFLGKATAPLAVPVVIAGMKTQHGTGYDEMGNKLYTRISSIAFSETELIEKSAGTIQTRKTPGGDLDLMNHLVQVTDSTKVLKTYIVSKCYPDETLDCIVLILTAYAGT